MDIFDFLVEIRDELMEAPCADTCTKESVCTVCSTFIKVDTYISQVTDFDPTALIGPEDLENADEFFLEYDQDKFDYHTFREDYDSDNTIYTPPPIKFFEGW